MKNKDSTAKQILNGFVLAVVILLIFGTFMTCGLAAGQISQDNAMAHRDAWTLEVNQNSCIK